MASVSAEDMHAMLVRRPWRPQVPSERRLSVRPLSHPEEDIANQLFRQYRAIKMTLRKTKPNPTLAPSGKVITRP